MTLFGDNISWENHTKDLPLNKPDHLFYRYVVNSSPIGLIHRYVKSGKLLDAGCHVGRWVRYFQGAGFDYTGVDQSEKVINLARKYHPLVKFVLSFLWDMNFENEFDIVVTNAVLQHNTLEEKKRILPKIHKALKTNGVLFMAESTLQQETNTQLTHDGWISLVSSFGFKFCESFHPNEFEINDNYLFKKAIL